MEYKMALCYVAKRLGYTNREVSEFLGLPSSTTYSINKRAFYSDCKPPFSDLIKSILEEVEQ